MEKVQAGILGLGVSLPQKILTNKDLEKKVDTTDEWIRARTGIKERRIASPEETTLSLAEKAGREAMTNAGISAEELDLIVVATVTPDMVFPATACLLQDALNAPDAAAFDLEAGCSGFVYGLTLAAQFINNGSYKNILVIGAEVLSRITDWEDRNTCVLFGDGAGAAVMGPVDHGGFLGFEMGSDGGGGEFLKMPAGGGAIPPTIESVEQRLHYIKMDGNQVFKFAVKAMVRSAKKVAAKANIAIEDIDLFIPHQANIRIIESSAKRLRIPEEKVFMNLEKYGNTSAASIPIAFYEAWKEGRIDKGDRVLLVGFGAGLTWGSCIVEWTG